MRDDVLTDEAEAAPVSLLYVDDDEILARRVRKRLERQGFHVTVAGNGRAGLTLAQERLFDLILVDHLMPVMGGLEMIQALGKGENSAPVVMVTGAGDESVAVEAMKFGASDYLVKDSDGIYLEMLPVVIEQALSRQRLLFDKQRAEAALRISEGRYRLLFTRMQDGFALLENVPDHVCPVCSLRFLEINPAFGALFGIVPEDLIGRCVCRLSSFPMTTWRPFIDQVRATGEGAHFDYWNEATGLYLQVATYRPQPGQIALIIADVTVRKQYEAELQRLATTDPLTGIGNRAHFFSRADTELARLRRYGGKISLLMLDLDHFKLVNDRYGHLAGDQVLITVAATLKQSLRSVDAVGRYGGEEFVILLPETGLDDAWIVAERLRKRIAGLIVRCGTEDVTITTSCGVTVIETVAEGTMTAALGQADQALYRAKHEGRNRTVLFPRMNAAP